MGVAVEALEERFPALVEDQEAPGVEYLAHVLQPAELGRGETLLAHGQRTDSLHLIVRGALEVSLSVAGGTLVLGHRGPGSWVGELGFVSPGFAAADVRAESDCELWSLSHDALLAMGRRRPEMAAHLLGAICSDLAARLRETNAGLFRSVPDGHVEFEHVEVHESVLDRIRNLLGLRSGS